METKHVGTQSIYAKLVELNEKDLIPEQNAEDLVGLTDLLSEHGDDLVLTVTYEGMPNQQLELTTKYLRVTFLPVASQG